MDHTDSSRTTFPWRVAVKLGVPCSRHGFNHVVREALIFMDADGLVNGACGPSRSRGPAGGLDVVQAGWVHKHAPTRPHLVWGRGLGDHGFGCIQLLAQHPKGQERERGGEGGIGLWRLRLLIIVLRFDLHLAVAESRIHGSRSVSVQAFHSKAAVLQSLGSAIFVAVLIIAFAVEAPAVAVAVAVAVGVGVEQVFELGFVQHRIRGSRRSRPFHCLELAVVCLVLKVIVHDLKVPKFSVVVQAPATTGRWRGQGH
mmetsp:Transcript_24585/g.41684  ORF Transcript_24585/g.41684 Transcript_24585/m.41684 type:complete len:256 (-) Transcript_24585:411-1178(-)